MESIRGNVSNRNLLVSQFKGKSAPLVVGYHKAAALDYTNMRHNGIAGTVTNSVTDNAMKSVTITAEGRNKKATTAPDGTYKIDKVKSGNRTLVVSALATPARP